MSITRIVLSRQQLDRFLKVYAKDLPPEVTLRDLEAVFRRLKEQDVLSDTSTGPLTEDDIPTLQGGAARGN